MSLDYRLIEAEIPQAAANETTFSDEIMAYVVTCLRWNASTFGRPVPQSVMVVGDGGPLTAFHDGAPRIRFQEGSSDLQRYYQAAHETFHAVWPSEVYHWSHEVMATWIGYHLELGREPGHAQAQLEAWTADAPSTTVAEMVAFQLDSPDWPPDGYYARCAVTALAIVEAEGEASLIGLATDIGNVGPEARAGIADAWIAQLTSPATRALFA